MMLSRTLPAILPGLLSACGGATAPREAPATLPASAPAPATAAPSAALEPGCVGLTADADAGLFVVEVRTATARVREARFVALTGARESFPLGDCPSTADEATCAAAFAAEAEAFGASGERATWLAGRTLHACATAAADADGALAVPLAGGLRVTSTASQVQLAAPSAARALWSADDRDDPEDTTVFRAASAYWPKAPEAAAAQPNVFVELHRVPLEGPDDVLFAAVPGAALGLAPCAARPTADRGPPGPAAAPVPFDPGAPGDDCVAATPDGRHAAFLMMRSDSFDESEAGSFRAVRWLGPEPAPALDLSCHANDCKAAARARQDAAARAAGLVACRRVEGAVRIDGFTVPVIEGAGALWLDLPGGPRWVRDLSMSAHDGGDHEAFESIFQVGATLPAFLYFLNADTGLSENRVTVLDDAAAGLCPR